MRITGLTGRASTQGINERSHRTPQQFFRTITDEKFILSDPDATEVMWNSPLPMVTLRVDRRCVASYSIIGIHLANSKRNGAARLPDT